MNNKAQLILETNDLRNRNTNHILHIILSILTVGTWVPIWTLVTISNSFGRISCEGRINKLMEDIEGDIGGC